MLFDPDKITFFARTDARGKNVKFGIKAKDRQRHVYVIGKTGMGKSTLLENMAVQDIQNGEGMAFIDPHGSAVETLLNYIPEHRKEDVVYFAPFDMGYPVSFNIMEDVGPDKRHLVVSGLMSVFKKIWVDAWSARMEYILQNTLLALLEYPDSTLLGVNRMLSDKDYRKRVVDNVKDPSVKAFWVDEFAKYNERYMQEAGDAIKNKIGQFTANPVIRNIVGQPKSSFDIRKIMDEQKIILMNLSKGLIGETNANLLGSMLTTRIYLAAMSRADLSPEKMREMPNFYFYVDEFQSFANATFANILSEARKYHLNLTIAHQYIEQMEEEVRNAVFGNVGTIVSFRVGPFDAEVLETVFSPQFLATDLVNLGARQIYLTLMIDGIGSQPFSATTLPPIEPPAISCKQMVIASSRRQFARPREEVEEIVRKFHEPVVSPKQITEKPPVSTTNVQKSVSSVHTAREEGRNRERGPERKNTEARVHTQKQPNETQYSNNAQRQERKVNNERNTVHVRRLEEEKTTEHDERQPEQRETRLNDLRSVLKNIVKADTNANDAVSELNAQAKQEKFEESHRELKTLLTQALKVSPVSANLDVQNHARESVNDKTIVSSVSQSVETIARPVPQGQSTDGDTAPREEKQNTKGGNNGDAPESTVTPKELERMMRLSTNDTSPR